MAAEDIGAGEEVRGGDEMMQQFHEYREMEVTEDLGYRTAMEMAGAYVFAFAAFGSYQGDWWARVEYNGVRGWVKGSYGSCSGCDAFEGEFSYEFQHGHTDDEYFHPRPTNVKTGCGRCEEYMSALKEFGVKMLDDDVIMTQEEAEKKAGEHSDWDGTADQMVAWIKAEGQKDWKVEVH